MNPVFTEERCYQLHLYKELITDEERRDRYQMLRLFGATRGQAMRWRDWSPNHYEMMLTYLDNRDNHGHAQLACPS